MQKQARIPQALWGHGDDGRQLLPVHVCERRKQRLPVRSAICHVMRRDGE